MKGAYAMMKNHISSTQVRKNYLLLLEEKKELEQHFDLDPESGYTHPQREATQELSMYDNHPADTATDLSERSKDIAIYHHAKNRWHLVVDALTLIQAGTYGTCTRCHEAIDIERLDAIPSTTTCMQHAEDDAILNRRPIEEQIMTTSYGTENQLTHRDEHQFEHEEAWKIVESWGNSDSPAMAENPNVDDFYDMFTEIEKQNGYMEPYESFVATDLYGNQTQIVRNQAYRDYIAQGEGEPLLERDPEYADHEASNPE